MKRRRKRPELGEATSAAVAGAENASEPITGNITPSTRPRNPIRKVSASCKVKAFPGKAKIRPQNPKAKFLPAQVRWVNDNSRIKLLEKCRQGGFTWVTSYRAVRETGRESNDLDTWVSSRDESMAGLFIGDCRPWAKFMKIVGDDLGEKVYEDGKGGNYKAFEFQFANGKTIYSLSSNPDAQAGKRGRRI